MIVLITGCSSGFGLLSAVAAARAGHRVYAGLRDPARGEALARAAEGLDVHPLPLDVTDPGQREAAIARILGDEGRIDALVNNAGIAIGGFLEQHDEAELRRIFEVNLFAVWALTTLCLPHLRAQGSGLILNISSMSARMALPGLGAYAASKHALTGMTEALRHELRPFGIRVALVEPGPYRTEIFAGNRRVAAGTREPGAYAAMQAAIERRFATLEMGDPQEVADLIVRLLDEPHPTLRYPLGPGARARVWLRRLTPFKVQERLLRRILGF